MEAGWGSSIVAYNCLCKLTTHHAGQVRGIGLSLFQHVRPCSSLVNVSPSSSWLMPRVEMCTLLCFCYWGTCPTFCGAAVCCPSWLSRESRSTIKTTCDFLKKSLTTIALAYMQSDFTWTPDTLTHNPKAGEGTLDWCIAVSLVSKTKGTGTTDIGKHTAPETKDMNCWRVVGRSLFLEGCYFVKWWIDMSVSACSVDFLVLFGFWHSSFADLFSPLHAFGIPGGGLQFCGWETRSTIL